MLQRKNARPVFVQDRIKWLIRPHPVVYRVVHNHSQFSANQLRKIVSMSEGDLYKGFEAPKGDGRHSGPLADLAKYKALGTSRLIGDRFVHALRTIK
jgi:hypothetical protein